MTRLPVYTEIAGVEGREPVGAVLSVGTKKPGMKQPVDRDRFYFKLPKVDGTGCRPDHPAFAAYNAAPPEKRRMVRAVVVHARREEWSTAGLVNHIMAGDPTPNKRPWCTGDGVEATRWDRKIGNYRTIQCPHDRCEYRQDPGGGKPIPCKPLLRVLFQPVWAPGSPLPTPLTELDARSWHGTNNMVGMWRHVEQQSIHLGVDGGWSWYAFPFSIHLTEQRNKDRGTNYPVLRFTPEVSVQSFLLAQAESRDKLAAAYRLEHDRPRAALTEPDSVIDVAEVAAALSGPREA
jgi:hypothetical protein